MKSQASLQALISIKRKSVRRARLSSKNETAEAIDYRLKRWPTLARFLDDGRLCIFNNAAERALRAIG